MPLGKESGVVFVAFVCIVVCTKALALSIVVVIGLASSPSVALDSEMVVALTGKRYLI